jgi:glucose-1-phosphate cytidylyltransferase
MKIMPFCGELGTRPREHSGTIPEPLVNVGVCPILWHLMRYCARNGHKDFVLCLGYRSNMIREYFLQYSESLSNDFVLSKGGRKIALISSDIEDWHITFVDTGPHSNIGQRLLRVRKYLMGEDAFLTNYADGLTELALDQHVAEFRRRNAVASLLAVRTAQGFHCVHAKDAGMATFLGRASESDFWINAGFFCLRQEIFDNLEEGDELVEIPFERLIARRQLSVNRHSGIWQQMDTFRDKTMYDRMEGRGKCPWIIWKQ